ncbi:hypothetical protein ACU8M5_10795 [Rhizobium leguminosarum]
MKKMLIAILSIATISISSPIAAQTPATIGATMTIGALFAGLKDVISKLEESSHNLLDHGNIVAAQQQMLLAGILKQTIQQAEDAYANSLNKTFSSLSVAEQNTFTDLNEQFKNAESILDGTTTNVQETIYKAQGAANQLLDRLPFSSSQPVFYGMTVGDLSPDLGPNPTDIEVLGFHLSDPAIDRKAPLISIDGKPMPPEAVSVLEDRIKIQIPDNLKKDLGFANTPCEPMRTFPITLTTYYAHWRGWWIFGWNEERSANFNANALSAAQKYDVSITYTGTKTETVWDPLTFSRDPMYRSMGCEDNTSALDRFEMPSGSRNIQCQATWINTSNVKNQSANCAVSANVATATGGMRGRDKEWTGNCPGGGHGSFVMSGSYEVPRQVVNPVTSEPRHFVGRAPMSLQASLGIDPALTEVAVIVEINRLSCPQQLDRIQIPTVASTMRYDQASDKGRFKAVLQNGQIMISEPRS